ncbi:hypothetical protein JVU11DRAFT_1036 [Chiua virens]|nr:hypothetical protein JVU11DRAFT_1036 [Chiua virens]
MSSPESLVARIIPARGAAQKASASFAEQLTDSPGRSDGDSPSSSNPFREPAQRTKNIKYRYTATGKHLSSPLKGSPSSPERKLAKPAKRMVNFTTPAPTSHVSKAKLPAVATTSRKRKASTSCFRKEDVLNSIFLASPSPLSSPPTSPTISTKDLPPSPTTAPKASIQGSLKRLPFSKALSLRALEPSESKFSVLSQPLSPKRKQKKSKPNANNSVWVLVNQAGILADHTVQPHDDLKSLEPRMWWPAQVVQKQPLRVSLFGDYPSSSSTSRGLCTIFAPSSSNIQSINGDSGVKRFSRTTFRLTSSSIDDSTGPPAKRPRVAEDTSIEDKWESAVQGMEKASTLERDGLPALLSTYAAEGGTSYDSLDDSDPDMSDLRPSSHKSAWKKTKTTEPKRKLKAQRSRANFKDDMSEDMPCRASPCPPDPTLQIPGELVLALAPKTGTSYWPARILAHVPDQKEKYMIKFLDDEEYVISRDKFWTSEEEQFARCTLGEWESAVKTNEDPESEDEASEGGTDDANVEDPNDITSLAPPPLPEDFENLSVRAQLAYVKPVLRAILSKQYAPARNKHEAFMRGGAARSGLWKSAGVRGGLDARFIKGVQKAICKWVLGDSKPKPGKLDTGDIVVGASGTEEPGGAQGETSIKTTSSEANPMEISPRDPTEDDAMQGVEGVVISGAVSPDKNRGIVNGTSLLSESDKQVEAAEGSAMVVDGHEQKPASLPAPTNGVILSPLVTQASLALKSQLDLLAEVSQAVATEPSLLPSHPEVPRLKADLLDMTHKDTSSQPSPLTPISSEDQQPKVTSQSALVVCEEFEILSDIERLDYCLNVLLPEAIQQLLLWQSGERTSAPLLSPEEEQRLHGVGARKAVETDWVDDVMRLRAASARAWGIDLNKKTEEKKVGATPGGTRSRPRLGTVSRP